MKLPKHLIEFVRLATRGIEGADDPHARHAGAVAELLIICAQKQDKIPPAGLIAFAALAAERPDSAQLLLSDPALDLESLSLND